MLVTTQVSKQHEEIVSKQFMKQFDRLISDINVQLTLLEAKTYTVPENHSSQTSVISDSSSSITDLSSMARDRSKKLEQIDNELMQLELHLANIEKRIQEDVEAEEIGIEFPIADIIDYMTAIKISMYKRHLLANQLHRVILNDEKFKEEAKFLRKDFAVWTKEEREDLLTKMARLEESLNKLQEFPSVYDDEFNKYYPLMNDLSLLKRFVSRFLDKYEMDSSTVSTARLTSSFSSFQSNQKETDSEGQMNVIKSDALKEMSKNA